MASNESAMDTTASRPEQSIAFYGRYTNLHVVDTHSGASSAGMQAGTSPLAAAPDYGRVARHPLTDLYATGLAVHICVGRFL
jgi:hypothetical protein